MAFAMVFPNGVRGGDRKTDSFKSLQNDLTQSERNAISRARFVLRNSPMGIAGIIPPIIITDIDPKLAVHRSNNQNRDATPGQKAMATAMAFPDPAKLKRKAMFPEETSDAGFNKATLSKARYVLRNSPMVEGDRYPRRWRSIAPITKTETQRQGKRKWHLRCSFLIPSRGKEMTC